MRTREIDKQDLKKAVERGADLIRMALDNIAPQEALIVLTYEGGQMVGSISADIELRATERFKVEVASKVQYSKSDIPQNPGQSVNIGTKSSLVSPLAAE